MEKIIQIYKFSQEESIYLTSEGRVIRVFRKIDPSNGMPLGMKSVDKTPKLPPVGDEAVEFVQPDDNEATPINLP